MRQRIVMGEVEEMIPKDRYGVMGRVIWGHYRRGILFKSRERGRGEWQSCELRAGMAATA